MDTLISSAISDIVCVMEIETRNNTLYQLHLHMIKC